jgi:hypothetical protein
MWAQLAIDFFDISPKYQLYAKEYDIEKIRAWQQCGVQTAWKFVMGTKADYEDLRVWLQQMEMSKSADIWLMPLTDDKKDMRLANYLLDCGPEEGFKMDGFKRVRRCPRLQIDGGFP